MKETKALGAGGWSSGDRPGQCLAIRWLLEPLTCVSFHQQATVTGPRGWSPLPGTVVPWEWQPPWGQGEGPGDKALLSISIALFKIWSHV